MKTPESNLQVFVPFQCWVKQSIYYIGIFTIVRFFYTEFAQGLVNAGYFSSLPFVK